MPGHTPAEKAKRRVTKKKAKRISKRSPTRKPRPIKKGLGRRPNN